MKHDEEARQRSVVQWWDLQCRSLGLIPEHLWHTPNGGKRSLTEAVRLKKIGVRAGVPDLFLAVPVHGKSGLFVEMKSAVGKTSQAQDCYLLMLQAAGYETCVCRSFDRAKNAIMSYLRTGCSIG